MDIQHLVDRLEELIDEGRHVFGTKFTLIDEERALEIIDQMRISIPEEIEKAAKVLAQRDRVLAQANEEAARILQMARQQGQDMVDKEISVQAAKHRADAVVEQARQEAQGITDEADKYVLEVLSKLEQHLLKAMNIVRNGINEVRQPVNGQAMPEIEQPSQFTAPAPRQPIEAGMSWRNETDNNK
jgi:vacuolar-type H+-ATPase subunit H